LTIKKLFFFYQKLSLFLNNKGNILFFFSGDFADFFDNKEINYSVFFSSVVQLFLWQWPEGVEMEEKEMVKKNQLFIWKNTWDYLEQQEFATEKDVKYVNELVKHLNSSVDKAKHQSLLTIK